MDQTQDIGIAESFIEALTGAPDSPVTFQTFVEPKDAGSEMLPQIFHGTVRKWWPKLMELQDAGHGVFFMVNEGNGRGRREENVKALRALFCDHDGTGGEPANAKRILLDVPEPHLVVLSGGSERNEHWYWRLEPGAPLGAFTASQKALAAKLGSDPAVHDLPRVLRLPGTLHQKDRSHTTLVTFARTGVNGAYHPEEVTGPLSAATAQPAPPPLPPSSPPSAPMSGGRVLSSNDRARCEAYVASIFATEGEGGDLQTFKAACACVRDFGLDRTTAWETLRAWNQTNASPPWAEVDLGKKFMSAEKYGKAPVSSKVSQQMTAIRAEKSAGDVATVREKNPTYDPSNWAVDVSRGGKGWREFRDGAWTEGISESALDRLLKNGAKLDKNGVEAWKDSVTPVFYSGPVYGSSERIATVDGRDVANTFRRPILEPAMGDCEPIFQVLCNLCAGNEEAQAWLTGWLAKLVQNVHDGQPARIGTAPFLFGAKGSGKGVLEEVMKACVGKWNVASISQRELTSDFNSYLDGVLLVFANEVWAADGNGGRSEKLASKIKDAITCHDRLINCKGVPEVTRVAVENWVFSSNSHRPTDVEKGDRRLTLLQTGPAIGAELGSRVADDARAGGPMVRAFLGYLLSRPREALVSDYRPLENAAKEQVREVSGNSATKFALAVRKRGFWNTTGPWGKGVHDAYVPDYDKGGSLIRLMPDGTESYYVTRRVLMDVYRAWASSINAPATQESTLLAALREEFPGIVDGEARIDGRDELCLTGLPGMLPGSQGTLSI